MYQIDAHRVQNSNLLMLMGLGAEGVFILDLCNCSTMISPSERLGDVLDRSSSLCPQPRIPTDGCEGEGVTSSVANLFLCFCDNFVRRFPFVVDDAFTLGNKRKSIMKIVNLHTNHRLTRYSFITHTLF